MVTLTRLALYRFFTSAVAFSFGALAFSIQSQAEPKRINIDNPKDPLQAKIYQLDNGLTVYLTENHQTPRFEANIAIRAGSKHDPSESTGLAHYLEHMLFKGTQKLGTLDYAKEKTYLDRISDLYEQHWKESNPEKRTAIYKEINAASQMAARFAIPNEMDKLYSFMGETGLNAHTSHEETVYQVNLPINRLTQWAIIESDRFQNPVFRLFQPELEIVYEEKNQTLDNKDAILHFAVGKTLFKRHPYGQQTTIGEVEHLKNPSLKNMYRFFETYYVPNNAAILISGDINPKECLTLISEHFASWKPKALPKPSQWEEPALQGIERVNVKYQGEEYVLLGFRLPAQNHPDIDAIKLIDMTLDNSVAGLINLNLNQNQKVRRAGSSPEFLNDHSAHYLWGVPKKGQSLKEVEDLLLQQIDLIKKGQFDDWILPAILTDFKKTRTASLESDTARVAMMREAFLSFANWDHTVSELDRLHKLTKADLVRVANQYYGSNFVAGYRLDQQHEVPSIQKPDIEKINLDTSKQSAFSKSLFEMPVEEIKPVFVRPEVDYVKDQVRDGVTLYYSRNPLNDLFTLTFSVDIGSRHDRKLSTAARFLDKSGTKTRSSQELKQEWYKLGTDFSITVGETETTISLAGLDENFEPSLKLLKEVLDSPSADDRTLAELKQILLVQRQDSKKDFRSIAGALSLFNRYGTNSPQLKALSNEELKNLTSQELHSLTRGLLSYQHSIGYVGAMSKDRLRQALNSWTQHETTLKTPPTIDPLRIQNSSTNRILFFQKEMAQSQLRLEFGANDYSESIQPDVQLFNEYFSGGMSGVVFQELRETRALAYSVGALFSNGSRKRDQSVMIAQIGCQVDKTSEALQAFLDLLQTLPESKERFAEAQNAVTSRYRTAKLGFREVLGAVRSWERLGVPVDPRSSRFDQIRNKSMSDLMLFHRTQIKDRHFLISLVGNVQKIKPEALGKFGTLQEVTLEQIFPY